MTIANKPIATTAVEMDMSVLAPKVSMIYPPVTLTKILPTVIIAAANACPFTASSSGMVSFTYFTIAGE